MCVLVQATNQLPKPQTHSAAPFVSLCHKPTTLVSSCKPWHTPTAQCHSCLAQATHQPHSTSIYVLVQATSQLCSTIYVSSLQCPPYTTLPYSNPPSSKRNRLGHYVLAIGASLLRIHLPCLQQLHVSIIHAHHFASTHPPCLFAMNVTILPCCKPQLVVP